MIDEQCRLLILGSSRLETQKNEVLAADAGWSRVESASLEQPGAFLKSLARSTREHDGLFVHGLGPVPTYLAAWLLPRSVPIIASGLGESEFFWNRWLRQRVSAFWDRPEPAAPAGATDAREFSLWGFGDWTSRAGIREILWAFTMIRITGWKCRLHLFGQGPWQATLRNFANLASTGAQIEFHPCYPDQLAGRPLPALVFAPQPQNVPDWLVDSLGETEVLTSAKSPTLASAKAAPRLVPVAWKPAVMAASAMRVLARCRESNSTLGAQVPESIRWNQAACYRAIRRHLNRICA